MALAEFFIISGYEVGNSQAGTLQYRSGSHTEVIDGIDTVVIDWSNLGSWTATDGVVNINATTNTIPVDYDIFTPGESYYFRLLDNNGITSSRVVLFTFPEDGAAFGFDYVLDNSL